MIGKPIELHGYNPKESQIHEKEAAIQALRDNSTKATSMNFMQLGGNSPKRENAACGLNFSSEEEFSSWHRHGGLEDRSELMCKKCNNLYFHPRECPECNCISCRECFGDEGDMIICPQNGCRIQESQLQHTPAILKEELANFHHINPESRVVVNQSKHRTDICDHCQEIIIPTEKSTHDCVNNLSQRCSYLEGMLEDLKNKFQSLKRTVRHHLQGSTPPQPLHSKRKLYSRCMVSRFHVDLPSMQCLRFRPDEFSHNDVDSDGVQCYAEKVEGLPINTQALIMKFTLSDLNVRRLVDKLYIKQKECNDSIDLCQYFIVGGSLPSFGLATEVILPWDMSKEQTIVLLATLNSHVTTFFTEVNTFIKL